MMPIPQCVGIPGGFWSPFPEKDVTSVTLCPGPAYRHPGGPRPPALFGMIPAQSIPLVSDHPCRDGLVSGMVPGLRFGYNKSIST